MYEHLRNDLIMKLSNNFNSIQMDMILDALDKVACDYEVSKKETSLVVYEDTFPRLAEIYLQAKALEGMAETSIEFYRNRLRLFFEIVQLRPEDVTINHIRWFLKHYKETYGIKDRTLDKFRQILNCFFKWCACEKYIQSNPCENIKAIKYEVEPRKSLNRMQLEKLRRACGDDKRDLAIVDVLYSTGCRISELVNMKKSDINPIDKSIHIIGKGKKHNTCYFNTNAQLSLEEYLKTRTDDNDYLFVGYREPHNRLGKNYIESRFRDLASKTDLVVTPHIIRHTTATLAVESGMGITKVQKILNHSNINTTMIYAETSQTDVMNEHRKYII